MSDELTSLSQFDQRLAVAGTPAEAAQLARDMRGLQLIARDALKDRQASLLALVAYARAARKAGEMLAEVPRGAGPGRGKKDVRLSDTFSEAVAEANLSRDTAHRWQQLAKVPTRDFESWCEKVQAGEVEPVLMALLGAAREHVPAAAGKVAPPLGRYRCLVIDPPWPVEKVVKESRPLQGVTLDYPTMSLEEIGAVPIPDLVAEDGCHVYLWVTHRFLPIGLSLFERWGVRYECVMTWVKPVGVSPFSWMYDTEHVLFGRAGSLELLRMGLRLTVKGPIRGHSRKPDEFYERVVAASPGPRLEMFARSERDGFEAWGNEVADGS